MFLPHKGINRWAERVWTIKKFLMVYTDFKSANNSRSFSFLLPAFALVQSILSNEETVLLNCIKIKLRWFGFYSSTILTATWIKLGRVQVQENEEQKEQAPKTPSPLERFVFFTRTNKTELAESQTILIWDLPKG